MSDDAPLRVLAVRVADWPVVAAGTELSVPAAVLHAGRVLACTPAARAEGAVEGLRRREAQARCPQLLLLAHDPARDVRAFEPVVAALTTLTPRVEITRPGTCSFATRGPARFHGGDAALAERAGAVAHGALGGRAEVGVGIADGPFAALLATARAKSPQPARSTPPEPVVVPPGESPGFLAPLPVEVLAEHATEYAADPAAGSDAEPALVDVLRRLGIRTLGAFAELPAADVLARFGTVGAAAHRLARGLDPRPLAAGEPPTDLTVHLSLDPPVEQVEGAAFAAKTLADALHERLSTSGLTCTRLVVQAETEHGERFERCWRHDGQLTAAAVADRVRWQLDGWLTGPPSVRPTAGITHLALCPDDLAPATGHQADFWGGSARADERVLRAVAHVEGLLGAEAVRVPEPAGGRGPAEQVRLVPAAAVELGARRSAPAAPGQPWPGQVPAPWPATVHPEPPVVALLDAAGADVAVDARGRLSAPPAHVVLAGRDVPVCRWAGPWLFDERWWDPAARRRCARLQVLPAEGAAHLLIRTAGRWRLEASYE